MTYLVERLAELRRHVDHLRQLRPRVPDRHALERDLSLHNDVLFSLLMIAQLVVDVAGELSARRGDRFEDYTEAVRNLARDPEFPEDMVHELERLPGFRNVVIHEYVALDLDRVVEALTRLDPIDRATVDRAKSIVLGYSRLSARDAIHVATMQTYAISRVMSFDDAYALVPGLERLRL